MDKRWKEGGNGKKTKLRWALGGLDSKPSARGDSSPFDVEKGKICSRLLRVCSDRKLAIFPHLNVRLHLRSCVRACVLLSASGGGKGQHISFLSHE